jgi:hypothetical protein
MQAILSSACIVVGARSFVRSWHDMFRTHLLDECSSIPSSKVFMHVDATALITATKHVLQLHSCDAFAAVLLHRHVCAPETQSSSLFAGLFHESAVIA